MMSSASGNTSLLTGPEASTGVPQAQRGYSRDHRPDCKQVNIALVVSRCGMPLGSERFAGNRNGATTLEEMVEPNLAAARAALPRPRKHRLCQPQVHSLRLYQPHIA
jgi:hypothetical protein